ncbi:hypothetical protein [Chitinophaga qingshengii]|uniref:Bacteriocin n=1 Tax=Chitinophaga qingshengii TaxID=1569794 RepID=A0ABR7TFL5_9BACT|nr:hypothetical protein [Chitinophaga qingshengii]MBC9929132.1 hypothetical protein [Chitinophaga qingshengii]
MKKKTMQKLKLEKIRIAALHPAQVKTPAGRTGETFFCPSHPGNCYTDECPPTSQII